MGRRVKFGRNPNAIVPSRLARMTTSNTATVMPNSQSRLSGEPVWRILTGFAIFALGVFLVGSVGSYNPQDPSFNAATDQEITNLFGAAGAATADVQNQSLGWGAMFGAFLVFS